MPWSVTKWVYLQIAMLYGNYDFLIECQYVIYSFTLDVKNYVSAETGLAQ